MSDDRARRLARRQRSLRMLVAILGATAIARGLAYLGPLAPAHTPPGLVVIDYLLPLWIWGTITAASGVAMIAGLWSRPAFTVGVAAYTAIVALWIVGYLVSDHGRGWLTSINYTPELLLGLGLARSCPPRRDSS